MCKTCYLKDECLKIHCKEEKHMTDEEIETQVKLDLFYDEQEN